MSFSEKKRNQNERVQEEALNELGAVGMLYIFGIVFILCGTFAIMLNIGSTTSTLSIFFAVMCGLCSVICFFMARKLENIERYLRQYVHRDK